MTSWVDFTNFGIACAGFTIALMGLLVAVFSSYVDRESRNYFIIFFIFMASYIFSDLISQISLNILGSGYAKLSRVAIFLESLFSSMLMPLLTWYLLKCSKISPGKNPILSGTFLLFFFYVTILIITQFSAHIYYITDDNVYHRGSLYPILLVPPVLLMLLNLFALFIYRKHLSYLQIKAFSIYLIIPLLCMLIQMKFYGLLLIVIGTSVSALSMFLFILRDQMEHYVKEREENARAQASIMVLKMRPHFIYNTMTSIYYLCEQNPPKAMETIANFTTYLRKNFSAIAKNDTIPFKEELEHVHTYLAIEQTRFEDQLYVKFDTPHINFRIPPLTLQPIVENSVKYGVDPELDPLYITISTIETATGSEIIVTDTGPGFTGTSKTNENDREPHIAISNIRERLSIMCNGNISFTANEGGGTVVKIWIPSDQHH